MTVFIGYDTRFYDAYIAAKTSILQNSLMCNFKIRPIHLDKLRAMGLYDRPTSLINNQLYDEISQAPMATQFAISRFLCKQICTTKYALFIDCDMIVTTDIVDIFNDADLSKPVNVVKHLHYMSDCVKMDGQAQSYYVRKNWSSVMLIDCEHPANDLLTRDLINTAPGRELHAFCWLKLEDIGALPQKWNYLVGHTTPLPYGAMPSIIHYTDGIPRLDGYHDCEYADLWWRYYYEAMEC
ncbi:MAG: glycosyltransferase [Candidatus Paceibacterota bacterium]